MRPGLAGAARRYARALLDVAGADAALLRTELRVVVGVLRGSRELAAALDSPVLPAERKKALVRALWGEAPIEGTLPVTIPGVAPRGMGIRKEAVK